MTRDDGWRFLSLGRHLERLLFVATHARRRRAGAGVGRSGAARVAARAVRQPASPIAPATCSTPEWPAVVDLLLFDARNPRSARVPAGEARQARARCCPDAGLDRRRWRRSSGCCTTAAPTSMPRRASCSAAATAARRRCSTGCQQRRAALSDALTLRYFSHVYDVPHATVGPMSERVLLSHRARDALRARRPRVDIAARRVPDAADAAAPARAIGTSSRSIRAPADRAQRDRLLRQRASTSSRS